MMLMFQNSTMLTNQGGLGATHIEMMLWILLLLFSLTAAPEAQCQSIPCSGGYCRGWCVSPCVCAGETPEKWGICVGGGP